MNDMAKTYDAQEVEERILHKWLEGGWYGRSAGEGDCTVVIPPPNVTGMLHMGHALDDTIQDTFVRFNRMRGVSTRWILGTDHAGIATQTKVDKRLKEQGIDRRQIGRDKFLEACWDWTREFGGIIVEQIKRMGCSVDFSDEKFTMDPDYARAVRKVSCDWSHDGLIYRGKRIVNWCPSCTTAISDDEAEYQDENGHLWHLRYPLKEPVNGIEYITVATTRPETMLGDTGVAVSPEDPDKAAFVGATVVLPIVNRESPIFSDWPVDAGFGSGFVKVTPAHDPNDYAMGQAHDLPQVNIFDEHAVVVEGYGEFSGMTREECREAVLAWFEREGLLDHVDDHGHSVMHCYRCDSSLEPWLSEQWFVAVDKLKGPATDVVASGKVTFHPQRWTQTYLTWMENLKDWCISRQLWWGHRIPVFYCDECGWEDALEHDVDKCPKCGSAVRQDEDVLDTWFSSQLWTFATQGWPESPDQMVGH
ncbi:MAG: class I tRNA ligase family protein, partial [Eggerthellaceae bacterium]|nr:class I tRNA ligase family protein [Eggerthellaceae bacterium]